MEPEVVNQIKKVLRLKIGEAVLLCDGKLSEAEAVIVEINRDFIRLNVQRVYKNDNEPDKNVILYCAILKKENFELVVQKATEVGILEIVSLITARTVKLDIRQDRLEKIIKEAAEQSGRGIVPILHEPINFEKAVSNTDKNNINFLFDSSGAGFGNWKLEIGNCAVGVWVGPEGGWHPNELEIAKKSGFKIISLGKTTLRAETAAIIGSYLAIHS